MRGSLSLCVGFRSDGRRSSTYCAGTLPHSFKRIFDLVIHSPRHIS